MQRRTIIGAVAAAFAVGVAHAQPAAPVDSAALLARIQSDKRGLVGKAMDLTPEEAARFWPLYDKFQRELDDVNRRQARAVLDHVAADARLTDANADRLALQVLEAAVDEARIRRRHYGELKKQIPPAKAARYVQVENKVRAVQQFELAKAIPLAQ